MNLSKSESSRRNGAKSRGPITPEGRAKSSLNAISHGITAKTLILQNEDPDQFLEMMNSYVEYFQPENQIQIDLVTDVVAARWRLRRTWSYETAMLDIEMDSQAEDFQKRFITHDEDMRGSQAFSKLGCLGPVMRYEVHLSRLYRRSLSELQKIAKRT